MEDSNQPLHFTDDYTKAQGGKGLAHDHNSRAQIRNEVTELSMQCFDSPLHCINQTQGVTICFAALKEKSLVSSYRSKDTEDQCNLR